MSTARVPAYPVVHVDAHLTVSLEEKDVEVNPR